MSVDNSELLMLLGGKQKAEQTIGIAGQQGFGVGVYGGDPADLKAMGLKPMSGCFNPASNNYGNYIHTNGSVMVFIPAFCYRIGNGSAPSYSKYGENTLEIRDASEGVGGGWILHRAFIDGSVQKRGFFIDKYVVSKNSTGTEAVSVKNGDTITLGSKYINTSSMPGCAGAMHDALTLGRSRGEYYSCVTAFQWSAISMLSFAHGQAATSNQFCGWYDAENGTNYPKGNNDNNLGDVDDSSVKWVAHSQNALFGKAGSGTPFSKTTHNGQDCGVTDVQGGIAQVTFGCQMGERPTLLLLDESVKAHGITKDNYSDDSLYNSSTFAAGSGNYYWGTPAFFTASSGPDRATCGFLPRTIGYYGTYAFGSDLETVSPNGYLPIIVGGSYASGKSAGIWARFSWSSWSSDNNYAFRISGYAN